MSVRKEFSEHLKALREAIGITQGEFAEALGVARATLSYYENGSRLPDIDFLDTVHFKTGCSLDYLMGYSDVMKEENEMLSSDTELDDKSIEAIKWLDGGPEFKNFVFSHLSFKKVYDTLTNMSAYDPKIHDFYLSDGYLDYKAYSCSMLLREIALEAHKLGLLPPIVQGDLKGKAYFESAAIELVDDSLKKSIKKFKDDQEKDEIYSEDRTHEVGERKKQDIEKAKIDPLHRFYLRMTGNDRMIEEMRKNGIE